MNSGKMMTMMTKHGGSVKILLALSRLAWPRLSSASRQSLRGLQRP